MGVDFLYNDDTITFPRTFRGSYSFSSLANFLTGTYNNSGFTQTFANSVVAQTNPNVGFYAQDEWKVSPRLTLNLGVRYDLEFLRTIATDTNNVSPRGGFAWTPFASRKTVIRGSYGLFYDRIPLRPLANALLSANNTTNPADLSQISISLSPGQAGAPVFPNILSSLTLPPGVLFNFSTMDPHMQNAYSEQGSFEIEQQLGAHSTLSVGYQHVRGLHLIISVNQNVPACTAAGTNNGCRPNPTFGNDSQYSSLADSHYDGLHVSFVQRPSAWGSLRDLLYLLEGARQCRRVLLQRADQQLQHLAGLRPLRRRSAQPPGLRRHHSLPDGRGADRLGATQPRLSVERLAAILFAAAVQHHDRREHHPGNRRAAHHQRRLHQSQRRIRVRFSQPGRAPEPQFPHLGSGSGWRRWPKAFNLTNHVNGVTLNGVFGTGAYPTNPSPTFKQITAVNDPRTLQFALRVSF